VSNVVPGAGFRHEAYLYCGEGDFVEQIAPFVMDGIAAGEPTLVMVSGPKINALRERIGTAGDGLVEYRDMQIVGANPARIIPAWDEFAASGARAGRLPMRGVGEPIWPGRGAVQLEECHWHEALINRAFAHVEGFWLICPYDTDGLDPEVVRQARTTHPLTRDGDGERAHASGDAGGAIHVPTVPLASPLAQPDGVLAEMTFAAASLGDLRALVAAFGARAGLSPFRVDDLVLAVSEVATNSVRHGGGSGTARIWIDGNDFVCEISDQGVIGDPLVDRRRPGGDPSKPRGLWTVNQLCDLVQVRSSAATGSIVRMAVHAEHRAA
jgi:anti-sigma regulatory factor (Ser/Thr protein kinase)